MDIYETVLILKPVLSDPEVAEFVEKTKQAIAADGGELLAQELWGRRKLTHMIGKNREGVYVFFKYKAAAGLLKKLSHSFSISGSIMREMTVLAQDRKLREKKKKPKLKAAAAGAQV
ncbi:MAG: 30S ribosomal protein S6 [Elusimicrobia bacterium]|nr:30S ribosomal protein S6 [Elusimicrobiota bacterium]MDE2424560.1 30S ribosomal protein S6 [Elusimicrobiota bacterium]